MAQVTNRGNLWEWKHSWWILLTMTPFTVPFAFFYIASKAKKKKWHIIGIAYIIIYVIAGMIKANNPDPQNIVGGVYFITWVLCIILAFIFRKEFLIRLDLLQEFGIEQQNVQTMRDKVATSLKAQGKSSQRVNDVQNDRKIGEAKSDNSNNEENASGKSISIDINSCNVEALAELPGISLILAKKAINYRTEHNGFSSVDDFYKVVDLKPHFIAQIEDKIVCNKVTTESSSTDSGNIGRKLDL